MRVKIMNGFVEFITGGWAAGITLAPFGIYLKKEYIMYKDIVNHESIHWKQQMEMLIIFFYIWYIFEWLFKLLIHGRRAYYYLSFEREAYNYEHDVNYLKNRKHYTWIKFLRQKDESTGRV